MIIITTINGLQIMLKITGCFFSSKFNDLYKKEICKKNYNDHFTIILNKL